MKTKTYLAPGTEALSLLFILYYSYTGFSKLWDYPLFVQLSQFQPWLGQLPVAFKWLFPVSELSIAALLLFAPARKLALYFVAFNMLAITGYRLLVWIKGYHLPCLCGPLIRKLGECQHLVLNLLLGIAAVTGIFFIKNKNPALL